MKLRYHENYVVAMKISWFFLCNPNWSKQRVGFLPSFICDYRMNQIRENVASAKKGPYDSGEIFFESQDEDEEAVKVSSERGTVAVNRFGSINSSGSESHFLPLANEIGGANETHQHSGGDDNAGGSEGSQSGAGLLFNHQNFICTFSTYSKQLSQTRK